MSEEYYVLENGEKTGPFSFNELTARGLDVDTSISTPGSDTWQNASYLPEFNEYFEAQGYYFPTEDNIAGFGWRVLAFIIDNILLSFLIVNIHIPGFEFPRATSMAELSKIPVRSLMLLNLSFGVVFIVYNTVFEASKLRGSIGKMVCRLQVVDEDGKKLTVLKALGRNFGAILSSMIYGLPFLTYFFSEQKQTWYDKLMKAYTINKVNM